jgi:hypothetical protein
MRRNVSTMFPGFDQLSIKVAFAITGTIIVFLHWL